MTTANKLLIVILLLGSGLGTALLFRKSPDSPDAVGMASSSEVAVASVVSGHLSLRHPPGKTPRYTAGDLRQRDDELANVSRSAPDPNRARDPVRAQLVETHRIESPDRSISEDGRSDVVRQIGTSAPATNMVDIVTSGPSDEVPSLPGRFPRGGTAGQHLRPVYDTVTARDRPVPSGDEAAKSVPETHRVVDGDTLEVLGRRYFGDPRRATLIHELNRDRIDDPRLLPIGLELRLRP